MRNELCYYKPGSPPVPGKGTPFEKRMSFKGPSVCNDAIYRINA